MQASNEPTRAGVNRSKPTLLTPLPTLALDGAQSLHIGISKNRVPLRMLPLSTTMILPIGLPKPKEDP